MDHQYSDNERLLQPLDFFNGTIMNMTNVSAASAAVVTSDGATGDFVFDDNATVSSLPPSTGLIIPANVTTLSDTQEKVLSLLPIIPGLLSVCGSLTIISMVVCSKVKSPYKRLLLGMSICDTILSLTIPLHAFLLPKETSRRVWAFGNYNSCSVMGALLQFSISALLYNSMLSFYFLVRVRLSWTETDIGRYVEPVLHSVALGFPLVSSITGLALGIFHETDVGLECYIGNYPYNCEYDPDTKCLGPQIAWALGGFPMIFTFVSLLVNNLVIYCHVRRTIHKGQRLQRQFTQSVMNSGAGRSSSSVMNGRLSNSSSRLSSSFSRLRISYNLRRSTRASATSSGLAANTGNDDNNNTGGNSTRPRATTTVSDAQTRRVQAVATQAILYVAAFILSNFWVAWSKGMEATTVVTLDAIAKEPSMFWVLCLKSLFGPIQGLLNLLVFIRPNYMRIRSNPIFHDQTKLWTFKRALYGESIKPIKPSKSKIKIHGLNSNQQTSHLQQQIPVTSMMSGSSGTPGNTPSTSTIGASTTTSIMLPTTGGSAHSSNLPASCLVQADAIIPEGREGEESSTHEGEEEDISGGIETKQLPRQPERTGSNVSSTPPIRKTSATATTMLPPVADEARAGLVENTSSIVIADQRQEELDRIARVSTATTSLDNNVNEGFEGITEVEEMSLEENELYNDSRRNDDVDDSDGNKIHPDRPDNGRHRERPSMEDVERFLPYSELLIEPMNFPTRRSGIRWQRASGGVVEDGTTGSSGRRQSLPNFRLLSQQSRERRMRSSLVDETGSATGTSMQVTPENSAERGPGRNNIKTQRPDRNRSLPVRFLGTRRERQHRDTNTERKKPNSSPHKNKSLPMRMFGGSGGRRRLRQQHEGDGEGSEDDVTAMATTSLSRAATTGGVPISTKPNGAPRFSGATSSRGTDLSHVNDGDHCIGKVAGTTMLSSTASTGGIPLLAEGGISTSLDVVAEDRSHNLTPSPSSESMVPPVSPMEATDNVDEIKQQADDS